MTDERKAARAVRFDNTDPSIAPHLFETLQDMQSKCPVAWSDAIGGFWAVTKYDDVKKAASDWESFTVEEGHTLPSTGKSVMLPVAEVDPPEHTAWRKFLLPYFTPKNLEQWKPQIRDIIRDAFAGVRENGTGDVVGEVANRVPTSVISAILGFTQDWAYISDITEEWLASAGQPERAQKAAAAVEAVVREEVAARRGREPDDILGQIMQATVDGRPISEQELLGLCIVFIVAGHGTTVDGIANTLHWVLSEPKLLEELRADRSLIGAVINESLRISPPVWNMARTARAEAEIGDVRICPGEKVMLTFGAANYDPDVFEDPTAFDPLRPGVAQHLTFGFGRHRCLGEGLAKLEITMVLEHILDELPDLEIAGPVEPRSHFTSYGLASLPVRRTSLVREG